MNADDNTAITIGEIVANDFRAALVFKNNQIDFLCDYIVNTHHQYVLKTLPDLLFYTRKIANVHGDHHPELKEVAMLFAKINDELLQHLNYWNNLKMTCIFTSISKIIFFIPMH
jgi:regulator of cell morphogenesis and NO signaling